MPTVFDKILAGELPCAKIYEDDKIFAFMDAFPQSTGHSLIIPKRGGRDIHEVSDADLSAVIVFSRRLAGALRDVLQPDGIKVVQFNGAAAGQTVYHYHMHLIPVWVGKPLSGHADDKSVALETLEAQAAEIRAALS